jgi:hypothetical protein
LPLELKEALEASGGDGVKPDRWLRMNLYSESSRNKRYVMIPR